MERLELIKNRRRREKREKELSYHMELHASLKLTASFCWDSML